MLRHILAILLAVTFLRVNSQTQFEKVIPNYWDASSIAKTPTGFVISGYDPGKDEGYLIVTDSLVNVQWSKHYAASGKTNLLSFASSAIPTSTGGYLLSFFSDAVIWADTLAGYRIAEVNSSGNIVWSRILNSYGCSAGGRCEISLLELSSGGYLLAGRHGTTHLGDVSGYLVKLNTTGDTVWSKTYNGAALDEINDLIELPNGNLILAGSTKSFGTGNADVYLIKTDSNGNVIWSKTYGTASTNDVCLAISTTFDGGFAMTGYSSPIPNRQADVLLMKTDSAGTLQWTKWYGGVDKDFGMDVSQTSDSGYFIVGCSNSFPNNNHDDLFVVRTNSSGDTLFTKVSGHVGANDFTYSGARVHGEKWITAGMSAGCGYPQTIFVVQDSINAYENCHVRPCSPIVDNPTFLQGSGVNVSSSCIYSDTVWTVTTGNAYDSIYCYDEEIIESVQEIERNRPLEVHPNPTMDGRVQIVNLLPQDQVNVQNMLGQAIEVHRISNQIQLPDAKGIYMVTVTKNSGESSTNKVIRN